MISGPYCKIFCSKCRKLLQRDQKGKKGEEEATGGKDEDGVDDLGEMMSRLFLEDGQVADFFWASPSTTISKLFSKSVDEAWAKELSQLPPKTRETINEELHGVFFLPEETPDGMASALVEMDRAIDSCNAVTVQERQAHLRALYLHGQLCRQHAGGWGRSPPLTAKEGSC